MKKKYWNRERENCKEPWKKENENHCYYISKSSPFSSFLFSVTILSIFSLKDYQNEEGRSFLIKCIKALFLKKTTKVKHSFNIFIILKYLHLLYSVSFDPIEFKNIGHTEMHCIITRYRRWEIERRRFIIERRTVDYHRWHLILP